MAILGTLLKKGVHLREMMEQEYTSPFDLQKKGAKGASHGGQPHGVW